MIEDARLEVSKLLGSIGLPPLLTMTSMNASSSHFSCHQQVHHPHHDAVIEYANAHIDLLHSMHSVLDTLRSGTSLRLGLGVSGGGDSRHVVSRVEKAWIMRQRRQQLLLEEGLSRITAKQINGSNNNNDDDALTNNDRRDNLIASSSTMAMPQCVGHDKSVLIKDSAAAATKTTNTRTKTLVLTFHKLRNILHRAIVDQAMSIHDTMKYHHENNIPTTTTTTTTVLLDEWNIFVHDLCYSITSHDAPTLSLSRLSNYIDKLGSYLSFTLSVFLLVDKTEFDNTTNSCCSSSSSSISCSDIIERSIQFAKERSAYLQSACPMSYQHHDEDDINDTATASAAMRQENRATGSVDNILLLKNLQDTFEAARICLWAAVGQSQQPLHTGYQTKDDNNEEIAEDARDWWTQFKYYIDRSCDLIPVVEAQYHHLTEETAIVNEQRRKEGTDEDNADSLNNNCCNNIVEVLEDVGKSTTLLIDNRSDELEYVDKTIVFTGSGIGMSNNVTQQNIIREKTKSSLLSASSRPAGTFNMMDQTMLLQDLELRLKSMGVVLEHEVIMDTTAEFDNSQTSGNSGGIINGWDDTISENPIKNQSNPLFLGVSGSLLVELTSAINTKQHDLSYCKGGYNDG
jgi:hypothetical protein